MSHNFQIFLTEAEADEKTGNINVLLGYPNPAIKITTYRESYQKFEGTDWASVVDDTLVSACAQMTPSQRLDYYDENNLKTPQWLVDNNWWNNGE